MREEGWIEIPHRLSLRSLFAINLEKEDKRNNLNEIATRKTLAMTNEKVMPIEIIGMTKKSVRS